MAVNIPAPARRRSGALRALVLAVLCAACENAITPPKTDNAVATVAVTAPATTLQNGSSMQLSAAASNAAGEPLAKTFTWTSSSDAVATVAADGTVTGKSPGAVTIVATSEGKAGTVNLTITPIPIPIASVSVSPDTATLTVGTTRQLAAVGRDASGGVLTGRLVAWASADSMIAKVSPTGVVTARAAGSVVITATSEGKSGTATITVVPVPIATVTVSPDTATVLVGATRQLAAIAWDAAGAPLTGRPVTWASADSMTASVSSLGLVTGRAAGSVVVTATSEGKSGTATITVKPATATLRVGITSQGDFPDPDGYEILYNGQSMGKLGGTGGMEVENLQPGQYTVAIRNVSLYCGVSGSRDRTVTLTAGETTEVGFVMECRRNGLAYIIYDGSRS
ncbi:MAG TPA: Ig-like domain-containing protein, partial [Longimicrobium sp.]|nr:Ig-like domain-containing protein [Longimicrobium sp.]